PAARNPASPHCTALLISGLPVMRPPMLSVSRRRFSIISESPMIMGSSLLAASAHEDVSVVEQATAFFGACSLLTASVCDGVSCASPDPHAARISSADKKHHEPP